MCTGNRGIVSVAQLRPQPMMLPTALCCIRSRRIRCDVAPRLLDWCNSTLVFVLEHGCITRVIYWARSLHSFLVRNAIGLLVVFIFCSTAVESRWKDRLLYWISWQWTTLLTVIATLRNQFRGRVLPSYPSVESKPTRPARLGRVCQELSILVSWLHRLSLLVCLWAQIRFSYLRISVRCWYCGRVFGSLG